MKENSKMESVMEKEDAFILMGIFGLDNTKKIQSMDGSPFIALMEMLSLPMRHVD